MSVWLSGHKVLGTNLNCSESRLGIRWWEIAAVRDLSPANVRFGSFASDMIVRIQQGMSASPRKRTNGQTSR
jgi:hypothetical protein